MKRVKMGTVVLAVVFAAAGFVGAGEIDNVAIDSFSTRLGMTWLPEKSLDGDLSSFWASSKSDGAPFIAYVFSDGPQALGLVQVTGHDYSKWRIDTAVVSYREGDSGDYVQLGDGPIQFNTYQGSTTEIDFGGVMARYVMITPITNFDGSTIRTIADNPGDGSTSDYMVAIAETVFNTVQGLADAGADQEFYDADDNGVEPVTLDGSASAYAGGALVSYVWTEDGASIATGPTAVVEMPVGEHVVTLTVTADDGTTDSDTVTITVVGTPQSFANAGADQVVIDADESGSEPVTLDGSGSAWSTAAWEWREGETVLGSGETLQVSLAVGVHTITLNATDMTGHFDSDDVVIDVRAGAQPPVADAGLDRTVMDANSSGDELVSLDGSGSIDYDGSIVAYAWAENGTQLATGVTPRVTLTLGVHTLELTVTDNEGRTGSDTVQVTVIEYVPSATDEPCVGATEADTLFDQITAEDMEIIRSKKILLASRSFGLNLTDGFTALKNENSMYALSIAGGFDVRVYGPSALPVDVFDNANFVQYLCNVSPLTLRMPEFEDFVRSRYADTLDAAIVFYHTAEAATFATYSTIMDSLRLDYPNIKFIYVTSGVSPVPGITANIESNLFGDQVMATYRGQVPIYDMISILSTHEDGSIATFEAGGQTYRYMCPEFNINGDNTHPNAAFSEKRMAKGMLVLLKQMFVEQPDLPGDANRDGAVNIDDFVILKNNFGAAGAAWGQGDFNGDGAVNIDDFVILKNNFGSTAE